MFALLPSWGLSNAAATLVGQNLGAGQPERAEASVWRACWLQRRSFLGVVGTSVRRRSRTPSSPWFTQRSGGRADRDAGLRIISAGFPFYAAGYVLTQAFNGAGDTVTPTLINIGCLWLGEIPLAYVLGRPAGFGPTGVFWAMAIAFSTMSLVSAMVFRRGRWKSKRV